jgi:hypothetical protein
MNKTEWHSFGYKYAREVEAWAQQEMYPKFELKSITLDWSSRRSRSRGGMYADGPGISIAMVPACRDQKGELYKIYEYASFAKDRDIGEIYTRRKTAKLEMTILHEVAHALQYYSYRLNNYRCKPHGPAFKNMYRRLRCAFLNPLLENQAEAHVEYEKIVKGVESGNFKVITNDEIKKLFKRAAST